MTTIITNIRLLVNTRDNNTLLRGKALAHLPCIENGWLAIEDGIIAGYGVMTDAPRTILETHGAVDAAGATLLPAWCDSHTHLVFAASREAEFVHKIRGMSYAEIAAKGEVF